MKARGVSVFSVAATYVGTVVGAGFATGQEILAFFTHFGSDGIYGVLIAAALLALMGSAVLRLGFRLQAESHQDVVVATSGPLIGSLLDWVITFFLFGSAAVMMAGAGAVFAEHWGVSHRMGTLLMALLAGGTVLTGLRGVVAAISAVAPLLVVMVLVIAGGSLFGTGLAPDDLAWFRPQAAATGLWPVSALLYVSYNLLLSISVLGPLGAGATDERSLHRAGLLGGAVLGLCALFIHLAVMAGFPESADFEVPMLYLARRFPKWLQVAYGAVLWAEIYTTAVSSLYGLAARLAPAETPRYRQVVAGATLGALVGSQFGFANLVGLLFPLVGWFGLLFIGGVLLQALRPRATTR